MDVHAVGRGTLGQPPSAALQEPGARVVGRLRKLTEDRYPEVYLLLRERAGWTQVRNPRPA